MPLTKATRKIPTLGILPVFEQLSRDLKTLHDAVRQGKRIFGQGDLAFMPLVQKWKQRIPYHDCRWR